MSTRKNNPITARSRRPSANLVITAVILVVAVAVIGGALLTRGTPGRQASAPVPVETLTAQANTVTSEPSGRVTLVEFLDFQCPACSGYYSTITRQLEADYGDRITFATRNFPLEMHPLAPLAARAAEAAENQGRYVPMYHALYDNYAEWAVEGGTGQISADEQRTRDLLTGYAQRIGLDVPRFLTDLDSDDVHDRVSADMSLGEQLGVASTPTFYLNGERYEPSGSTYSDVDRELRARIDQALAAA